MGRPEVRPGDLREAAAAATAALRPALERDWGARAGDLEWSCRDTVAHAVEALRFYAANLAVRTEGRRPFPWIERFDGEPEVWLAALESAAAVLAEVAAAAPAGTRAFHPAGMADAEGFLAMGCDEVLVHAGDVAAGLGVNFVPPDALAARVLARLFPWATARGGESAWELLRWANGRAALPGRARLDADWWWHCAPLEEWGGGGPRRRTEPPPR